MSEIVGVIMFCVPCAFYMFMCREMSRQFLGQRVVNETILFFYHISQVSGLGIKHLRHLSGECVPKHILSISSPTGPGLQPALSMLGIRKTTIENQQIIKYMIKYRRRALHI